MSSMTPNSDSESLNKVGKITVEVFIWVLRKVLIYLALLGDCTASLKVNSAPACFLGERPLTGGM